MSGGDQIMGAVESRFDQLIQETNLIRVDIRRSSVDLPD
jgi:hypothetical protein